MLERSGLSLKTFLTDSRRFSNLRKFAQSDVR